MNLDPRIQEALDSIPDNELAIVEAGEDDELIAAIARIKPPKRLEVRPTRTSSPQDDQTGAA